MDASDLDEIPRTVELLLQDVWKAVKSLKSPQRPATWLLDHQWKQFKNDCSKTIERSKRERLSIGLVAPPRSGKTTMVNALLGIQLLPTDTRQPIQRIVTVHYTPRKKGSKLKLIEPNGKVATGLEGVRQHLTELFESPSNDDWQLEPPLELNAAFCKSLGTEADSVVKLDLMEMPSLSSMSPYAVQDKTKDCLESLDGAIYLIDSTKLKTEDEQEIVKELKEAFGDSFNQLGQRLFFCVTKAAVSLNEEQEDNSAVQNYVSVLLRRAGFAVQPAQIFVVSALHALLSRLVIADKNNADVHVQFGEMVWGGVDVVTDKSIWKAKAHSLLELSGIPRFEEEVLGFLHKNCDSLILISLLDECIANIQNLINTAQTFKNSLTRNLNEMRHGKDRLKIQLDYGNGQMELTKIELRRIEDNVNLKAKEVLTRLKNVLLNRIGAALSGELTDDRPKVDLSAGWSNIHQDYLALTNHLETDRKHAEELVKALHEEVVGQIKSEMEIAWMLIEDLIRDRHFELVLRTNQDLDHLSKILESVVVRDLNVQIEPSEVKLRPLNNISFERDVTELLASCIKKHQLERSYMVKYLWGRYYSVYVFNGGAIREFFENIVREIIEDAINKLQSAVSKHLSGQIATSEEKIRNFAESFVQAIESAIETKTGSIESTSVAMQRVIEDIDSLEKLKNVAVGLKRTVESGLAKEERLEKQDELQISTKAVEEDQGRYVPPRSRLYSQDSIGTPKLSVNDRTDSFPFSDFSDSVAESPKSASYVRSDNWRVNRTGSGSWAGTTRSNWANGPPVPPTNRETPRSQNGPAGESFSPRSNFFRGFQQTPKGGRGRGIDQQPRTGASWNG